MTILDWLADPRADRGINLLRADRDGQRWERREYRELAAEVRAVAAGLRAAGVGPGEVVSLVLADSWSFIASFWGAIAAGAVPSPLATPLAFGGTERYVAHLDAILRVARPALVLTDAELGPLVAAAPASGSVRVSTLAELPAGGEGGVASLPAEAEGLALLQFTSGSTGTPKGVRISRRALEANVAAIRSWLHWGEADSFASWLPLYHDMGLIGGMVTPVVAGTELWLMTPDQFLRSPLTWLECFGRHGATLTTSPSFGYGYVARRVGPEQLDGLDFSGWRVAILGAERIDPAVIADFHRLAAPRGFSAGALLGAYGLAEVTLAASGSPVGQGSRLIRTKTTALSIGEPVVVTETGTLGVDDVHGAGWMSACGSTLQGLQLQVVDEGGAALPDGTFGEISLAGASLADGWLVGGVDGPTVAEFTDGVLRTGDSGFSLDGELFVVGRLGESMKVRGAVVHAEDVELELAELPDQPRVRCAVAFGHHAGESLALVFVEGDLTPQWLTAAVNRLTVLTGHVAVPLVLQGERGAIARTSSGKPRRRTMWGQAVEADPAWTVLYGRLPDGATED